MELNEYQKRAMSTCMKASHNYVYMAEGMVGEMGEFMSKVAKAVRKQQAYIYDNDLICKEDLEDGLKAELGDIMWFIAGVADVMGWDLEDVTDFNLIKLASRQQRGVIDGNGDNR